MSDYEQEAPIDDETKAEIAAEFLKYAPPGEFNEVYNDVAALLDDENILRKGAAEAVPTYNLEQFLPVEVPNSKDKCLLTPHAGLPNGRYLDPKSKQSFNFNHMTRQTSDWQTEMTDGKSESLRGAIETQVEEYVKAHYPNGTTSVYGNSNGANLEIIVCIEDHEFQSRNHWGGRWRSFWKIDINGGSATIEGLLRIQVHYYEDGNVQLLSKKDVEHEMSVESDSKFAAELVKFLKNSENEYQAAISDNYVKMSDTTFKALRRQLPMTKTKIDWQKLLGYRIGKEASQQAHQ